MRFVFAVLLLTACSQTASNAPRYAADIFAEDTAPVPVTVRVTGPMTVSLRGAGFYSRQGQQVVMTPATLVIRGTGTAIIGAVDSSKPIALVPAGTPLDSTGKHAIVARLLKLSRPDARSAFKLEIQRP
jgi:hypothetical protein